MPFVFLSLTYFTQYDHLEVRPCSKWRYCILFRGSAAFHHTCATSLSITCQWAFGLSPCLGYCEQRCCEHRHACIFLTYSSSLDIHPEVGLDQMVILFLVSWGTTILFSIMAAPTFVLHQWCGRVPCPFFHTLSNILVFVDFLIITILTSVKWYLIVVLICICGTTDWFQIGKGVRQGCILSPCLFNLHAEYIMRNAGLEEAQAGIKIAGRNINNLRYADDTTLTFLLNFIHRSLYVYMHRYLGEIS